MALDGFQPRAPRPVKESFKRPVEDTTMLSLRIDSDLHRKLKARAAVDGESMTNVIERVLKGYLE